MWSAGYVFRTATVGNRELVRSDFMGGCIFVEGGFSTPIKGLTGSAFLVGLDPAELSDIISPVLVMKDAAMDAIQGRAVGLAPKAVILSASDTRGLVLGGTAYIGFMG